MAGAIPDIVWATEFSPAVREIIAARDTPPGRGRPVCVVCGEQAGRVLHVHHARYKSRGGDGRPSNGLVVCPEEQGDGCHKTAIHDNGKMAAVMGWAISRHAPEPGCYRRPVMCAWRGWIILFDRPGRSGLYWRPVKDDAELRGDYGTTEDEW